MLIPIDKNTKDPYYRYKMQAVEVSHESNKTNIKNLYLISKTLYRLPDLIFKYISLQIGCSSIPTASHASINSTFNSNSNETSSSPSPSSSNVKYYLNGIFKTERIQIIVYDFIEIFVICEKCRSPETKFILIKEEESGRLKELIQFKESLKNELMGLKYNKESIEKILKLKTVEERWNDSKPSKLFLRDPKEIEDFKDLKTAQEELKEAEVKEKEKEEELKVVEQKEEELKAAKVKEKEEICKQCASCGAVIEQRENKLTKLILKGIEDMKFIDNNYEKETSKLTVNNNNNNEQEKLNDDKTSKAIISTFEDKEALLFYQQNSLKVKDLFINLIKPSQLTNYKLIFNTEIKEKSEILFEIENMLERFSKERKIGKYLKQLINLNFTFDEIVEHFETSPFQIKSVNLINEKRNPLIKKEAMTFINSFEEE